MNRKLKRKKKKFTKTKKKGWNRKKIMDKFSYRERVKIHLKKKYFNNAEEEEEKKMNRNEKDR